MIDASKLQDAYKLFLSSPETIPSGELRTLLSTLSEELRNRISVHEPDAMAQKMMDVMFSTSGPMSPVINEETGLLVIAGQLDYTSSGHKCKLVTVETPEGDVMWSWDDGLPLLVGKAYSRVDKKAYSVQILHTIPGTILEMNSMKSDGYGHDRLSFTRWLVTDDWELEKIRTVAPSRLPPPHGQSTNEGPGSR